MNQKIIGFFILYLCLSLGFSYAQTEISGKISNQDGIPLSGVTVSVKGEQITTSSGASGNFSIKASVGNTLVFRLFYKRNCSL